MGRNGMGGADSRKDNGILSGPSSGVTPNPLRVVKEVPYRSLLIHAPSARSVLIRAALARSPKRVPSQHSPFSGKRSQLFAMVVKPRFEVLDLVN